jgi:hypothetical protein
MYQTIDNLIICNGRKNVKIPKGNQKPPIKGQTILPSQQRGRKDRIVTTTNRTCLWSPVTDTHTLNSMSGTISLVDQSSLPKFYVMNTQQNVDGTFLSTI